MTGPRIEPAQAPFEEAIEQRLRRLVPAGVEPPVLFRTLARDPRLFERFVAGGLLDRGQLSIRQRELAILRTTARCKSAYEWGLHAVVYGAKAGLSDVQVDDTYRAAQDPALWDDAELALFVLVDVLHETATLTDVQWEAVRRYYSELQVLELLMLAGFYRTVAYLTNGLALPQEPYARTPSGA